MAEATIAAFEDHGTVSRTVDTGIEQADRVMDNLRAVGVDMDEVGHTLEDQGVDGFHQSFAHLLTTLRGKARQVSFAGAHPTAPNNAGQTAPPLAPPDQGQGAKGLGQGQQGPNIGVQIQNMHVQNGDGRTEDFDKLVTIRDRHGPDKTEVSHGDRRHRQ